MGGLRTKMKTTFWVYLIGALALSGIAPLAGFFSKDEILAFAFSKNPVMFGMLLLAAFFTAFYMARQVWMVFFAKPRSEAAEGAKENPPVDDHSIGDFGLALHPGWSGQPAGCG